MEEIDYEDKCAACLVQKQFKESEQTNFELITAVHKLAEQHSKTTRALKESLKMIKTLTGDLNWAQNAIQTVGPRQQNLKDELEATRVRLGMANNVIEQLKEKLGL